MAWFGGGLWVAAEGGLTRIDGATNATTSYPIAVNPASLEPGKGVLYVTTDKSPPKLSPVPANKQASFLLSEDWLDDTDPAHAYPVPAVPGAARVRDGRAAPQLPRRFRGHAARGSCPRPPRRCRR